IEAVASTQMPGPELQRSRHNVIEAIGIVAVQRQRKIVLEPGIGEAHARHREEEFDLAAFFETGSGRASEAFQNDRRRVGYFHAGCFAEGRGVLHSKNFESVTADTHPESFLPFRSEGSIAGERSLRSPDPLPDSSRSAEQS